MTTDDSARTVLDDSFGRIRDLVTDLTDGLTDDVSRYRPDPGANSIGWLLWHVSRIQDDHVAGLADVEQVWPRWRDRFALPLDDWDTGYAHSAEQVASVHVDAELLAGYHADVHESTQRYLARLDDAELARVVDRQWTRR